MRCAAIVGVKRNCQQEWIKRCEHRALFNANGVIPLCGTHINHPPELVCIDFHQIIYTTKVDPNPDSA